MEDGQMTCRTFLNWFSHKLVTGKCPHCDQPITQGVENGCSVYAYPCGCELYRVTVERMKVVCLDEYRRAKEVYEKYKKEDPNLSMSFKAYCIFRTRFRNYARAKMRKLSNKSVS
jgi:hypothetical protein